MADNTDNNKTENSSEAYKPSIDTSRPETPWKADPEDLTVGERLRKWKSRSEKNFFRWLTVKVIYPLFYAFYRIRKVDEKKVLFVEPTQLKPTNSMRHILRTVENLGTYNVVWMSLGHNKVRKRYQLIREINFIKE